jgi:hypothetical protein
MVDKQNYDGIVQAVEIALIAFTRKSSLPEESKTLYLASKIRSALLNYSLSLVAGNPKSSDAYTSYSRWASAFADSDSELAMRSVHEYLTSKSFTIEALHSIVSSVSQDKEGSTVLVTKDLITKHLKTKGDCVYFFGVDGGFYLPPDATFEFFMEVLNGEKKLLKKANVVYVDVPIIPEIDLSAAYASYSKNLKVIK